MRKLCISLTIIGVCLVCSACSTDDSKVEELIGTYISPVGDEIILKENKYCQVIEKEQHRMVGTYYQMEEYRESVGGTGSISCTNGGICHYWDTVVDRSKSCYYEFADDDRIILTYKNKSGSDTARYTYSEDYNTLTAVVESGKGVTYKKN